MSWRIIDEQWEATQMRRWCTHREFQCESCGAVFGTGGKAPPLCRCGASDGNVLGFRKRIDSAEPVAASRLCSGRLLFLQSDAWTRFALESVRVLDLSSFEFPVREGFCDVEVVRDPAGYSDVLLPPGAVAEPQVWINGSRIVGVWGALSRSFHMLRAVPTLALVRIRWRVREAATGREVT